MQVIKPHVLTMARGNLRTAAIISSVVVIPFVLLELVNRRDLGGDFPIPLFGFMWLLALAFIVILTPILRSLPAGRSGALSPARILPGIALLILIGWLWVGLVLDQMPCFLGVPNCD